jgi:protein gp37
MSESKIEWTQRTWNPIVGCSIVSPGCTNCYAMRMASRLQQMPRTPHYAGTTKTVNGHAVWTGKLARAPEVTLLEPLKRKKPTTYFVNSMGDLFHEDCPDEWILRVLDIIRRTSWDGGSNCGTIDRGDGEHTYQVLTKRASRMAQFMRRLRFNEKTGLNEVALYLADDNRPPLVMKNLWLGVSCERQEEADERIPLLLRTPAAVRFISAEPLLGPINLRKYLIGHEENGLDMSRPVGQKVGACIGWTPPLDWVIAGGESGPHARAMHPGWVRRIRDDCAADDVAFFFKQFGEWAPFSGHPLQQDRAIRGRGLDVVTFKDGARIGRVGKKAAGRLLDGVEHNAYPRVHG